MRVVPIPQLPISVLLPTRNSMPLLEKHVSALNAWLMQAEEVIVVDSCSTDGTFEYLKANLKCPSIQFFSQPPGLYESWNFGIMRARAEFIYVATVGDGVDFKTLDALTAAAREQTADVVIGVPEFTLLNGTTVNKRWPIHDFVEQRGMNRVSVIPPRDAFLWNALYSPQSLLGSSAGNLYSTAYMQQHAFPTEYGHAGDTAWALLNSFAAKIVVSPQSKSLFLVHPRNISRDSRDSIALREHLNTLARQIYHEHAAAFSSSATWGTLEPMWLDFWTKTDAYVDAKLRYHRARKFLLPWWMSAAACRARADARRLKLETAHVRKQLLERFH